MWQAHDWPPTLGLVLAGGLARRMGGGDKALIAIGGAPILDRVLAQAQAGLRASHPQCERRPRAVCRLPPAGRRGPRARLRRSARGRAGGPRLGRAEPARSRLGRERAGRLPVSAGRSRAAAACGGARGGSAACLRTLGRVAASGGRPLAGGIARRSAPRAPERGAPQDRGVDRPARRRPGEIGRPSRLTRSSTSMPRKMSRSPSASPRHAARRLAGAEFVHGAVSL